MVLPSKLTVKLPAVTENPFSKSPLTWNLWDGSGRIDKYHSNDRIARSLKIDPFNKVQIVVLPKDTHCHEITPCAKSHSRAK